MIYVTAAILLSFIIGLSTALIKINMSAEFKKRNLGKEFAAMPKV